MKLHKNFFFALIVLVLISAVYRAIPFASRPFGAPQWAIAIFAGFLFVKDKKWAFVLPLLSMLVADLFYELLYRNGWSDYRGFYGMGQVMNYLLFVVITCVGFFIRKIKVLNVLAAAIAGPTVYFLLSNFLVWAGHGGLKRPMTFEGLLLCYNDGIPFYLNSLSGTIVFSALLFGGYYAIQQLSARKHIA